MTASFSARSAGERIEQLLDQLEATGEHRVVYLAEELLRSISDLYGAGLAQVVALARAEAPGFLEALAGDGLVASLLIAHGLHPLPLHERVERALARVRPLLGAHSGDVELIEVDPDPPKVRLRLLGSCDGCPSASVTLRDAVQRALLESAPELVAVEVEETPPAGSETSVQLSRRPGAAFAECPAGTSR